VEFYYLFDSFDSSFEVLGIKHRGLCMTGKRSTMEVQSQLILMIFVSRNFTVLVHNPALNHFFFLEMSQLVKLSQHLRPPEYP
jgi:hypothetical protein